MHKPAGTAAIDHDARDRLLAADIVPGARISRFAYARLQNLVESKRQEFVPEFLSMTPTQVERAVYGRMTLRF